MRAKGLTLKNPDKKPRTMRIAEMITNLAARRNDRSYIRMYRYIGRCSYLGQKTGL
jgi:hypothetical protein